MQNKFSNFFFFFCFFFCGFPWVETSTVGRVYDLCVYYMTGAPEGSPKVVLCGFMVFFMEKPGIEPATPGLQGIALIHYTTGAFVWVGPSVSLMSADHPTRMSRFINTDF